MFSTIYVFFKNYVFLGGTKHTYTNLFSDLGWGPPPNRTKPQKIFRLVILRSKTDNYNRKGNLRVVILSLTSPLSCVTQDKDGSFHCRPRRLHELMNVSSMYDMFGGRRLKWAILILCSCCSEDGVVADDSD